MPAPFGTFRPFFVIFRFLRPITHILGSLGLSPKKHIVWVLPLQGSRYRSPHLNLIMNIIRTPCVTRIRPFVPLEPASSIHSSLVWTYISINDYRLLKETVTGDFTKLGQSRPTAGKAKDGIVGPGLQSKGRVTLPNQMNFRKDSKR